jgi:xylan 1,4-beta-xylosidase
LRTFRNPVLPGCYPDPSICRVGADYYLVTSTFEYFPGLPVFTSRDLVSWRQVGHVLDRRDQVDLSTVYSSGGLFAPTIRHHDGRFLVVCTAVGGTGRTGSFVVTATDPAGPWSDPAWLDDAPGIDPSLFVDDDGRSWYVGTRPSDPAVWPGQTDVWLREIELDPARGGSRLTGPEHVLWHGALTGAVWAEGPHLYRVDGRYYLVAAEGGTEHNHAVSVARADRVTGPYVGNPANPVLTHRHLGRGHAVVGVGHADLVQTPAGEWWAVLLGSRPYGGYFPNLGRETFLVPVDWEDGWPVFAPGVGQVAQTFPCPVAAALDNGCLATTPPPAVALTDRDDFDRPTLGPTWNQVRTGQPCWSLTDRPGWLRLVLQPATLADVTTPTFVGRRQQHREVIVSARIDVRPDDVHEEAGLAVRQSEADHLLLVVAGDGNGGREVRALRRQRGELVVLGRAPVPDGDVVLTLRVRDQDYGFEYRAGGRTERLAGAHGGFLSSPEAGGFLGVWLGLYASSNGRPSGTVADVDWFEYVGCDPTVTT